MKRLERPRDRRRSARSAGPRRAAPLAGLEAQPELAQLLDELEVLLVARTTPRSPPRARARCPRPPGSPPGSRPQAARRRRSGARGSAPSPSRPPGCSGRRGRGRTASRFEAAIAVDRVRGARSRRSRPARAAAPSSAGRGRASSGRGPPPRAPHELLADALDVGRRLHPVDQRLEPARRAARGSGSGA